MLHSHEQTAIFFKIHYIMTLLSTQHMHTSSAAGFPSESQRPLVSCPLTTTANFVAAVSFSALTQLVGQQLKNGHQAQLNFTFPLTLIEWQLGIQYCQHYKTDYVLWWLLIILCITALNGGYMPFPASTNRKTRWPSGANLSSSTVTREGRDSVICQLTNTSFGHSFVTLE